MDIVVTCKATGRTLQASYIYGREEYCEKVRFFWNRSKSLFLFEFELSDDAVGKAQ